MKPLLVLGRMTINSPFDSDWDLFLRWAKEEGWRVPAREVTLFRGPFADGAFVLREEGAVRGFVTAVRHEKSGWIGNLIVDRGCRGRGLGAVLFAQAVDWLRSGGIASLWLTASPMGRPIYEKWGFRQVGEILRWTCPPGREREGAAASGDAEALFAADALVWGESRRALLSALAEGERVFSSGSTAALLQAAEEVQVLGPWLSLSSCPRENRRVLAAILQAAHPAAELIADVLGSSPAQTLLAVAGFEARGRCALMVRGPLAADLSSIVALASLGSVG